MKYLFVDFFSASNRGDAAILDGMKNDFCSVDNQADIEVLSYHKASVKYISKMKNDDVLVSGLSYSFRFAVYIFLLIVFAKTKIFWLLKFLPKNRRNTVMKYLDADAIVSVGGAHLNDNYSKHLVGRLLGLLFAKYLNKKVIIYSQSIGPFNKPLYRSFSKFVLNKVDLIIAREEETKKILDKVGIRKPKIEVATDSAFSVVNKNNESYSNDKYATIAIRKWEHDGYDNKLKSEIVKYIEWLIVEQNINVNFVSTCTGFAGYHMDDRLIGLDIDGVLSDNARKGYRVIMDELSPYELMNWYSGAVFHVGMRMHSCILTFNSGTPFIPIAYEHKTVGISKQCGFDEFLMWAGDVKYELLVEYSKRIIENEDEYQKRIATNKESIKKLVEQNRILLKDCIS